MGAGREVQGQHTVSEVADTCRRKGWDGIADSESSTGWEVEGWPANSLRSRTLGGRWVVLQLGVRTTELPQRSSTSADVPQIASPALRPPDASAFLAWCSPPAQLMAMSACPWFSFLAPSAFQ